MKKQTSSIASGDVPMALSVVQAAQIANSSRTEVYEALKAKRLKAKKLGRRTIILRDDLYAYLLSLPDYSSRDQGELL